MDLLCKLMPRVAVAAERMFPSSLAAVMAVSVSVWTIVVTQVVQGVAQLRVVNLAVALLLLLAISVVHIVEIKIAMNTCAMVDANT